MIQRRPQNRVWPQSRNVGRGAPVSRASARARGSEPSSAQVQCDEEQVRIRDLAGEQAAGAQVCGPAQNARECDVHQSHEDQGDADQAQLACEVEKLGHRRSLMKANAVIRPAKRRPAPCSSPA